MRNNEGISQEEINILLDATLTTEEMFKKWDELAQQRQNKEK